MTGKAASPVVDAVPVDETAAAAGSVEPLSEKPRRLVTLSRRQEFLRVRGGGRWSCDAFVVEGKPRDPADEAPPRFGFTVTKKLGGAVVRNRIRRRLKACVTVAMSDAARRGWDYVVIARAAAEGRLFVDLASDMRTALARVAAARPEGRARRAHRADRADVGAPAPRHHR
jgi:ribonuclease P protein component